MCISYIYGSFNILNRFDSCSDGIDRFSVSPWFTSPYTEKSVYFIICPTHQVYLHFRNMCHLLLFFKNHNAVKPVLA